ncbi:MAG: BatD family protein [Paludibacteraceae bacterium]|nr:BatD family protein [Paludibacteraceae bacterium]
MNTRILRYIIGLFLCIIISPYVRGEKKWDIKIEADTIAQLEKNYKIDYFIEDTSSTPNVISVQHDWNNDDYTVEGPSRSNSSGMSFHDGKLIHNHKTIYRYTLKFKKEGVYSIPPVKFKLANGKQLTSESIIVRVESQSATETTQDEHKVENRCNIRIKADITAQLEEKYRINYICENTDSLPNIISVQHNWDKDDYTVEGPFRSTSSNMSISDGKRYSNYKINYLYILKFKKEGAYSIPPFTIKLANGEQLSSKSINVQVKKQSSIKTTQDKNKNFSIIAEIKPNETEVAIGDSIECDLIAYIDEGSHVVGINDCSKFITNAYYHEQHILEGHMYEKVSYNGAKMNSYLLKRFIVVPLQSGKLTIEPISIGLKYDQPQKRKNNVVDIPSFLLPSDTIITTKAIEIKVSNKRLPTKENTLDISNHPHKLGLIIDYSGSLSKKIDTLSESFLELEKIVVDELKNKLTDYSTTIFAGKPHYPTDQEIGEIPNVNPSENNNGSAVYDAIIASALREGALTSKQNFSIILLTDGDDNRSHISESYLINLLLKNKIRVDIIALGSKKENVFYKSKDEKYYTEIKNRQDLEPLKKIAKATNGMFIMIENKEQIPTAIQDLMQKLQKNESPNLKPDKSFKPNQEMLYKFYEKIISESKSDF